MSNEIQNRLKLNASEGLPQNAVNETIGMIRGAKESKDACWICKMHRNGDNVRKAIDGSDMCKEHSEFALIHKR